MPHAPGQRVGPYEILGTLGAGGMGIVYRARDLRLQRDVALKFLQPSADAGGGTPRLMREARAASSLNHPHICAVYDVGEFQGADYIAMEYVEGRPLEETIPPGGFDPGTVIRRAKETADALSHAHGRGIIHRDLKSANILCDGEGRLKVLDFGLAHRLPQSVVDEVTQSVNSLDAPGVIAGTLPWMAPEVLRGAPADARSDLWALGVLIHQLSTGTLPFGSGSSFEVASRILNDPPPPVPARIPPALRRVAEKLLEKDPAARYQSAAEARAALDVIGEDLAPRSADPAATERHADPGRPRSRWVWAGAAAALALAAAVAMWWALRPWGADGVRLYDQRLVSTDARRQASPSLSPDGRTLAFVAPDDQQVDQIWAQPLTQGDAVQITRGSAAASRPRWSPNSDEIVFTQAGQGIWAVGALGGTPRRILEAGTNPNLSRDGAWMVYEQRHRIWIARPDGSMARMLEHVPAKYYSIPATPALSPDASHVVYFRPEAGPNGDFWIAPVHGGTPRRLTADLREGGFPLWTADDLIIFSSARAGSRTLWQVSSAGGEPEPLTTGAGEDDEPELSRDGRQLVYSNVRNTWQLVIGDANGSADRTLLERRTEVVFPQFSPDGSRIAFFSRNDRAVAIFTVGAEGSDLRALTGGTELNHMPRWSANGDFIYFFQIHPEPSFRRIPAPGGASEPVLPLNWEVQNFPQFDPTGRFMSYTLNRAGAEARTMVRDITTGAERALSAPALWYARWSRDGRRLVGWRRGGTVVICDSGGADCRELVRGLVPVWSGDGSRIYFLRRPASEPRELHELWSIAVDGRDERLHRVIGEFREIDIFFDVSSRDQVVWGSYRPGRRELWVASLR